MIRDHYSREGLVYCGNHWVLKKWDFANITKSWDKGISATDSESCECLSAMATIALFHPRRTFGTRVYHELMVQSRDLRLLVTGKK